MLFKLMINDIHGVKLKKIIQGKENFTHTLFPSGVYFHADHLDILQKVWSVRKNIFEKLHLVALNVNLEVVNCRVLESQHLKDGDITTHLSETVAHHEVNLLIKVSSNLFLN